MPTPPPLPSWKLAGKCRTCGAKGAIRNNCLMQQSVEKWLFTPCVFTQNTRIFQENSMIDKKHIGPNVNTVLEQSFVRDGLYLSG